MRRRSAQDEREHRRSTQDDTEHALLPLIRFLRRNAAKNTFPTEGEGLKLHTKNLFCRSPPPTLPRLTGKHRKKGCAQKTQNRLRSALRRRLVC